MEKKAVTLKKGDKVMFNGVEHVVYTTPRDSSVNVQIQHGGMYPRYVPKVAVGAEPPPPTSKPSQHFYDEDSPMRGNPEEKREREITAANPGFEAQAEPIRAPLTRGKVGEHVKHYIINYVTESGEFKVERIPGKGIVHAITQFYCQFSETAIVSVICVL